MDFDFTTKAGWQKFFVSIFTIGAMVATNIGLPAAQVDTWVVVAATAAEFLGGLAFYIANQAAARGKAASAQKVLETKAELVKTLAITAPEVAVAVVTNAEVAPAPKLVSPKEKVKLARSIYSTWEAAKQMMLGTFKDRYEAALKRYASMSLKPIEVVRKAVEEVAGVTLTDKECEAIGNTPGFVGAVTANLDIRIIGDLLAAIDGTPELAYLKTTFIKRAVWYAVKGVVDDFSARVYADHNTLKEVGFTDEQIRRTQQSGMGNMEVWDTTVKDANGVGVPGTFQYRQFDPYYYAGVDPTTMENV